MVCKHKGLLVVHEFIYGEAGKNKAGPFIQSVSAGICKTLLSIGMRSMVCIKKAAHVSCIVLFSLAMSN